MAQILVAQNSHGIALAAENMAVQLDDAGKELPFLMNRLLPLTSHAALLTTGAAEGVEMGNALKDLHRGREIE